MNLLAGMLHRWWLGSQAAVALIFGAKASACALYERIVLLYPGDTKALSSVGNLRMQAGDSAGAVEIFSDLVRRQPDDANAWFNLGYVHEKRDELEPAEHCMREAMRANAKHDRAWYGLALVLIRKGELAAAVSALEQNILLQPMSPYGYYQLGMTLHHLGRVDESRRIAERLRQFEPKYAATLERDIARTPPNMSATGTARMAVVDHPAPLQRMT